MTHAPEEPTRLALRQDYGISKEVEIEVLKTAMAISEQLTQHRANTIAIIGGCAMTNNKPEIIAEGKQIDELGKTQAGLTTLHRIPPWKPRTNPIDWHGLETGLSHSDNTGQGARVAYDTLATLATRNGNVAIEVANREHIERYGPMLSFGWTGSRNIANQPHILYLAQRDPMMPIGVKNGIDGDITEALDAVGKIDKARSTVSGAAPAVLIYRGGERASNPTAWEDDYLDALARTDGKLIVDVAHGSEMAHDPEGKFQKSAKGQELAMETVIELAKQGHLPAGIMIEASDIDSPTDPVLPLQLALDGVKRLHAIKQLDLVDSVAA